MSKYFITGYIGEGAGRMFRDLEDQEQVMLLAQVIPARWKRFLFFRIEHFTKGFRRFAWLKKLFYRWYAIFNLKDVPVDGCFIFVNSLFMSLYDPDMLQKLKKKYPGRKMVLYIVDPMAGFCGEDKEKVIAMMDLVYSVHPDDCKKYGFHYHPLVYSAPHKNADTDEKRLYDLYYLGSGTDRTEFLARIADRCRKSGIRTEFHVVSGQVQSVTDEDIHFHVKPLSYEENEQMIRSARCMLELMHEGFQGATQRYMEAVIYGKKLLTNNDHVTELEFYDPRYIRVFHSVEEIEPEFLLSEKDVDYGYHGEYSPVCFIDRISRQLNMGTDGDTIEQVRYADEGSNISRRNGVTD